ncbi:MAG: metallophosphoesterase family protein [Pseudomonadota bacterium]
MIGIISDVHGNYAALSAVIAALDRMKADAIVCLGDVAGYYAQINECCDLVKERVDLVVQGNHDWYLTSGEECPRSDSANRCLAYQRKVITGSNLEWLATLVPSGVYQQLNLVHGGWRDPLDEYLELHPDYFSNLSGAFFASGHTHLPVLWRKEGKHYCNPGSVGQPRDGDPRAAFATFDGHRFALHRVSYDIGQTQKMMQEAGFSDYFYNNLDKGVGIGGLKNCR